MGEGLAQQAAARRQRRPLGLKRQPVGGMRGQGADGGGVLQQVHHPVRQQGGGGELGAPEHRDLGRPGAVPRHQDGQVAQPLEAHHLAADQEAVALGEGGGEILLDLAQLVAAPAPFAAKPDGQRLGPDDGPEVHADGARGPRVAQAEGSGRPLGEAFPLVVGAQRVATRRAEFQAVVELRAGQVRIGAGAGADLPVKRVRLERPGAGGGEDMLAEHVQRPVPRLVPVQVMIQHRVQRRPAFQHLETVGGHDQRAGGGVVAVVGPADALHQPLDVLGRADLHHQVHVPPVDPQIQRAGADHRAQRPLGHRRLDPPPGLAVEAAVVDADGQGVVIDRP